MTRSQDYLITINNVPAAQGDIDFLAKTFNRTPATIRKWANGMPPKDVKVEALQRLWKVDGKILTTDEACKELNTTPKLLHHRANEAKLYNRLHASAYRVRYPPKSLPPEKLDELWFSAGCRGWI